VKAILALLVLTLAPRSYGDSIKDDVAQYDASVVSASTHFKNGITDFNKSRFKLAEVEYSNGKKAIETAKQQERDIRAYLSAHPKEPQSDAIQQDVDGRSKEIIQIDANLDSLEQRVISERSKHHLIVQPDKGSSPRGQPLGNGGSQAIEAKPSPGELHIAKQPEFGPTPRP
jgi:hypothetical protein